VLGALTLWFVGEAAGPHFVSASITRLGDRRAWSKQVLDEVDRDLNLKGGQRRAARRWLESENVLDALVAGDRHRLEEALSVLADAAAIPTDQAGLLLDRVTAVFLQILEPSVALGIAEYRRSVDQQKIEIQLAAIKAAVESTERRRLARSTYHRSIEQIKPPFLVERAGELEELGRFCTCSDPAPAYVWWRADAWAGKSALLSTFALSPPPGVDIVAFFITARQAGQSDRTAFLAAVAEQATALLGEERHSAADPSPSIVLDLLARAAAKSRSENRRLVLLVDGLDEDTDILNTGHSIAAVIPAVPWHGLRVILASRLNPPIPPDVPLHHPLRDAAIGRELSRSKAGRAARGQAAAELDRLLEGNDVERDTLGLITAAGGGLSMRDIHEISSHPLRRIEQVLYGTAGRTFLPRISTWAPDVGPRTYILGHEELQKAARTYLASDLPALRERVHRWADNYVMRSWPQPTPEYLLTGYFGLLRSTNDLDRMIHLSLDHVRHDRMLDIIGGDFYAFTEVVTTIRLISKQPDPPLASALQLARYRHNLEARNAHTPIGLPAVWASLGHPTRAEALARSIASAYTQALALAYLAGALAETGRFDLAELIARNITRPAAQAEALANLASALAKVGQIEDAARVTRELDQLIGSIMRQEAQAWVLVDLATALAKAQHFDEADRVARSVTEPDSLARALASLATSLAKAGRSEDASRVAAEAERVARNITHPATQAQVLANLATSLAKAGWTEDASRITAAAAEVASSITDTDDLTDALTALAIASAHLGRFGQVKRQIRVISDPFSKGWALAELATALARAGRFDEAERLVRSFDDSYFEAQALADIATALAESRRMDLAEQVARSITKPDTQARSLAGLAAALAKEGRTEDATEIAAEAERVARNITEPAEEAEALARLATALAKLGRAEDAARVANKVEQAARSITNLDAQERALAGLTPALANAGDLSHAEAVARSITDPYTQARALLNLATALAKAGRSEDVGRITEEVEQLARNIRDSLSRARTLANLTGTLASAGNFDQAEQVARSITAPDSRASALADLASALAHAGWTGDAARITEEVEQLARNITDPAIQAWVLGDLAAALANAGRFDEAERVTSRITEPDAELEALGSFATALANAGRYDEAEEVAHSTDPGTEARVLINLTTALANSRRYDDAEKVARSISDTNPRTRALAALSQALAEDGDAAAATRLAVSACEEGDWSLLTGAIGRLDSSALSVIAEDVCRDEDEASTPVDVGRRL
jgi:tetratricopeptide (TPR) repeat protein